MVSLAVLDLPLEASNSSGKVHNNLRKELEFTLSRLMALDLLSICIDNSIASVLWSNSTNHACLSRSLLNTHSYEILAKIVHRCVDPFITTGVASRSLP
jgi:hypothetical protein